MHVWGRWRHVVARTRLVPCGLSCNIKDVPGTRVLVARDPERGFDAAYHPGTARCMHGCKPRTPYSCSTTGKSLATCRLALPAGLCSARQARLLIDSGRIAPCHPRGMLTCRSNSPRSMRASGEKFSAAAAVAQSAGSRSLRRKSGCSPARATVAKRTRAPRRRLSDDVDTGPRLACRWWMESALDLAPATGAADCLGEHALSKLRKCSETDAGRADARRGLRMRTPLCDLRGGSSAAVPAQQIDAHGCAPVERLHTTLAVLQRTR